MGIRPSVNDELQTLHIVDFSILCLASVWVSCICVGQDIGNREEMGPAAVLHVIALRHRTLENLNALNL